MPLLTLPCILFKRLDCGLQSGHEKKQILIFYPGSVCHLFHQHYYSTQASYERQEFVCQIVATVYNNMITGEKAETDI